jgi:hypothetical protein
MTETQIIEEAFRIFSLSLDDIRKILEVDYGGPAPNFLLAESALAITEPISKAYYPLVHQRGGVLAPAQALDDVSAKEAAHNFFTDCFSNDRYSQLSNLIWDCFRNGHVHLFQPKKVINVPLPNFDNSFLTGVHYSSTKPSEIITNQAQQQLERGEHLRFDTTLIRGHRRPFLRFSPLIYYLDLVEAVQTLRGIVDTDAIIRQRFLSGYQLLINAKRLDFGGTRIPQTEKDLIINELTGL